MGNWDSIEKEEIDDLLKSSDIVLIYDTKLNFQVDDSKPNNKIEIHYYKTIQKYLIIFVVLLLTKTN